MVHSHGYFFKEIIMAKSLVLTVNIDKSDISNLVKSSTDPYGETRELENLFRSINAGTTNASIIAQIASVPAVQASGTITLTYASVANLDTVTVAGITLTCVTGTPTGAQFKKVTDGPTTAANLAALINSLATLNIYVSATSSGSVVTVKANQAGVVGNLITLATSNGTGFGLSAAALENGAGGAVTAATTYGRGL